MIHQMRRRAAFAVLMVGSLGLSATAVAQTPSGSPGGGSPRPNQGPGWLGADTLVYGDDFGAPSGWTIREDEAGSTAYQDGGLVMSVAQDGSTRLG